MYWSLILKSPGFVPSVVIWTTLGLYLRRLPDILNVLLIVGVIRQEQQHKHATWRPVCDVTTLPDVYVTTELIVRLLLIGDINDFQFNTISIFLFFHKNYRYINIFRYFKINIDITIKYRYIESVRYFDWLHGKNCFVWGCSNIMISNVWGAF